MLLDSIFKRSEAAVVHLLIIGRVRWSQTGDGKHEEGTVLDDIGVVPPRLLP